LGTAILVIIGDGSVAQVVTSNGQKGDFFTINIAFAFAIAYGVYVSGSVSGGHINPAVTLVMAVLGKTAWIMLPIYWAGQYLGAFFGASIVHWVYRAAILNFGKGGLYVEGPNATAGIFATYPASFVTSWDGFVDQMIGTAILLLAVLALTDERNMRIPSHYTPIIIGFVVGVIGMSFGYNAGFALNPARDLGPRIYTAIAGWGGRVFSYRDYDWFWVPIIGPHVGAFVGMAVYKLFVGLHWPSRVENEAHHEEEQIRLNKRALPE
jgi:aquaporin-3